MFNTMEDPPYIVLSLFTFNKPSLIIINQKKVLLLSLFVEMAAFNL